MPATGHDHYPYLLALQHIPNASRQFYPKPADIMSSSQPGPPPGNASLDLKAPRKQLDEDYGKAYDLMEADRFAFLSNMESILETM